MRSTDGYTQAPLPSGATYAKASASLRCNPQEKSIPGSGNTRLLTLGRAGYYKF